MKKNYKPLSKQWSSIKLFSNVKREDIILNADERQQYHDFFKCDLESEYDAKNLYKHIITNLQPSAEFRSFLTKWVVDELNHSAGFSRILNLLFDENEAQIKRELKSRKADYSLFKPFFNDEFKLCVLIAYDEYYTFIAYNNDTFYDSFGPSEFSEWIKRVRQDEATHFMNLIKLIRFKYNSRVIETEEIFADIIKIENQNKTYKSTFLFDHNCVDESLNKTLIQNHCIEKIRACLSFNMDHTRIR